MSSATLRLLVCVPAISACLAAAPTAYAAEVDAETVAARVQAFYDQTRSVGADFVQTYFHKLYSRYDRSDGTVLFVRPGKMRWDYAQPNGKIMISDGKQLRIYEPGEDGAKGQVFEQKIDRSDLPQALGFLLGTSRLSDDFRFRLLKASGWKYQGHVLELRPKVKNPAYKQVLFFVDAHPDRLGVVHRVLIVDHTGNRNKFEFSHLRFNRPFAKDAFSWRAPKGTRVIRP